MFTARYVKVPFFFLLLIIYSWCLLLSRIHRVYFHIYFFLFFDVTIRKFVYIDMLALAVFGLINGAVLVIGAVFDSLELACSLEAEWP